MRLSVSCKKIADTSKKISDLSEQDKEELKKSVTDYLQEDADISWPVIGFIDSLISLGGKTEDCIELCYNYKALNKSAQKYKALVKALSDETQDEILNAAIDEISITLDNAGLGIVQAVTSGVTDIGLWGGKKVINEAYKNTVLNALPVELRLSLQFGTIIGDTITSCLFANDDTEKKLKKLECIGTLGRAMIRVSDSYEQKYQDDKKNNTSEMKQNDAEVCVRSIESLFALRNLSCDYSEIFADKALDGTVMEKVIRIFISKKDAEYKDYLKSLIEYKQNALKEEEKVILSPLDCIFQIYPDAYKSMTIDDMSVEDYTEKILDSYKEKIDSVPDKYSPEFSYISTSTGKANNNTNQNTNQNIKQYLSPDKLIDDFIFNDRLGYSKKGKAFYLKDLQDETNGAVYKMGPVLDIDNDGENELLLTDGFYGGMYLDAKNGKLTVFEEGQGTDGVLGYGYYDGKWVVCHKDTSHTGRNVYSFTVYRGADNIVESFNLSAEYWEADNQNSYDDNSLFTFKDEIITRKDYENLLREIFSKGDPRYATIRFLPEAPAMTDTEIEDVGKSISDIVSEYESEYGKLEFKTGGNGKAQYKYYTGVFLLKKIDFDRDDNYEYIIGYATEIPEAQISNPKLDVWQVKNDVPIQVYEGACIYDGDIGSRCEFLNHTSSNPELVIGNDGYETDLHFLTFENGVFNEKRSLKYEFNGSDYVWSINGETVDEVEGMEFMNVSRNNINKYTGIVDENLGQTEKNIRDDLNAVYKVLQ